jgi:menaquinone-dependent protoporphyrinogen oxidase
VTVLVAAASKYGATAEIAEAVGRALRESGISADVRPVEQVGDLSGYTDIVLGSAVYVGRWLEPARRFVEEHADELAARPTWLFSSGPVGDPPKPEAGQAVQVEPLMGKVNARGHRLFAGRIDKSRLGFGERALTLALRVPEGDFRDWEEIAAWAKTIARAIGEERSSGVH